ncbi:mediator of DNA damage checkpoint protein 1 [Caloenas nicobarica]|uniref:mediator of DNA damage checkpoint protein 1 n=1 Tax=Caloenas nicobarica TaxID=187106 RepID=UPI0032B807DC
MNRGIDPPLGAAAGAKPAIPDVAVPQNGPWALVESDTDVDSDPDVPVDLEPPTPDVGRPKTQYFPQKTSHGPDVTLKRPNPDIPPVSHSDGDSDTDVELEPPTLDAGRPQIRRIRPKTSQHPDVQHDNRDINRDSETDVEGDPPNPAVSIPKTPLNISTDPPMVPETPDPDVAPSNLPFLAPNSGDGKENDSDGDPALFLEPTQNFLSPADDAAGAKPAIPEVPTPQNGPWPLVESDTDVDSDPDVPVDLEPPTPDVGRPKTQYFPQKTSHGPDVTLKRPNPDIPPVSHSDGDSDTDVELELPTLDAGRPQIRRIRPKTSQHPDVQHDNRDINRNSETDVEGDPPNLAVSIPKTPLNISTDPPMVPETPDPDVAPSNLPFLAPNSGDGKENDSDGDPALFLEPTQNFLSPADDGWDPEEPTQRFDPPEEEKKETPPPAAPPCHALDTRVPSRTPGSPLDARVPQAVTVPSSEEVGAGLRRSQRLAESRGGGAKGDGAPGPAPPSPACQPWCDRLRPRPPAPELPITRPCPPPKPRPPMRRARQEEAESPLVPRPKLRPRVGPSNNPPQVLFTGLVAAPALLVALGTLGGSVATDVTGCSHLVTDRVRRTVKFLCGVARGIPIVTPQWLLQSAAARRVLPPDPFLVSDPEREGQFGFQLSLSLRRARQRPLLQGYEIHVTPSVHPPPEDMRDIVTCAGGTFLPRMPRTYRPRRLVITCPEDAARWGRARALDLPLSSAELLLTGMLRQSLELRPFRLPAPPPEQTPPP